MTQTPTVEGLDIIEIGTLMISEPPGDRAPDARTATPRSSRTTTTRRARSCDPACAWLAADACPAHGGDPWSSDLDSLAALMRQTPGGGRRGRR